MEEFKTVGGNLGRRQMHCHTADGAPGHKSLLLPLTALGALGTVVGLLYFAGVPSSTLLLGAVVLMCPLSHLLMMRGRGHGH